MDLSVIITNFSVFNEVQQSLHTLAANLRIQNQPIQYLYDLHYADENISDNEEEATEIVNSNFCEDNDMYIANEYCSEFHIG